MWLQVTEVCWQRKTEPNRNRGFYEKNRPKPTEVGRPETVTALVYYYYYYSTILVSLWWRYFLVPRYYECRGTYDDISFEQTSRTCFYLLREYFSLAFVSKIVSLISLHCSVLRASANHSIPRCLLSAFVVTSTSHPFSTSNGTK